MWLQSVTRQKREHALESIVEKPAAKPNESEQDRSPVPTVTNEVEGQYPQKSPQSGDSMRVCREKKGRKSLKKFGSPSATLQEMEIGMCDQRVRNPLIRKPPR